MPDAKTVWLFRERIKHAGLIDALFLRFHEQLAAQGYVARKGQMIDATFVEVPRQRNSRDENEKIKAGETPDDWQTSEAKAKLQQKDVNGIAAAFRCAGPIPMLVINCGGPSSSLSKEFLLADAKSKLLAIVRKLEASAFG